MATISQKEFLGGGKAKLLQSPEPPEKTVGAGQQLAIGAIKGVGKTVQNLGQFGSAVGTTLNLPGQIAEFATGGRVSAKLGSDIYRPETELGGRVSEALEPRGNLQKAGYAAETIAEFLIPFGQTKAAAKVGSAAADIAKETVGPALQKAGAATQKLPSKISKQILGEEGTEVVTSAQNPAVKLFQSGARTVKDVVENIEKNILKFEKQSKAELQAVKESIPNVKLKPSEVAVRVNQGIMNSIQHSADYRGIKTGFETADDIINSGILKPEETKRIQDIVEFVRKWKDTSARGVLNLKESLGNFYAVGENYTGANAVLRSIQRNLVDYVSETLPEIKPALKQASKNIDKTDEFVKQLLGRDTITGETKILTLARNLADKARNGEKINLLKELEKLTGSKAVQDLEDIYDYLQASKLKAPGLLKPVETAKFLVKKAIEKTVPLK